MGSDQQAVSDGESAAGEIVRALRGRAADHMKVFKEDLTKSRRDRRDYETMSITLTMAAGEIEKRFCK